MEEKKVKQTWKQKILFYITAFFVLLGIFSVFSFLFLVPFVIDPAFTTIFMDFDEQPALCVTVKTERKRGVSNCSWASCREGCTKEVYDCTQIHVNYKRLAVDDYLDANETLTDTKVALEYKKRRALRFNYDYADSANEIEGTDEQDNLEEVEKTGNNSKWYYTDARLFPNVKGCGYPPALNCTIFLKKYKSLGTNFSCYYSRVDPGLVISHLDMWQVYMNLIYAMAIPIPSFILSVIYLTFAYFKIYNDDEEKASLEKSTEGLDEEKDGAQDATSVRPASGALTPASEAFREDLASFGHQLKVAMADETSRDSFNEGILHSLSGNVGKEMTTSISTPAPAGPIADL